MLGFIVEFFPLFVVRWIAATYCEDIPVPGVGMVWQVRPDVIIKSSRDYKTVSV